MLDYGYITHSGCVREHNEDNYLVDPEMGLWVVADGMGGHACGEVASQIVVDLIHDKIRRGSSLQDAVQEAHHIVLVAADQRLGLPGMGSTVVAALHKGDHYEIAWVGDSRAYLWENGKIRQLTRDHSYVQQMVDSGTITQYEARVHPHRNIITQAIGAHDLEQVEVGLTRVPIHRGQYLLLCSDGLSDELSTAEMASILGGEGDAQVKATQLMELALANGGNDNVTAILMAAPKDAPVRAAILE